MAITFDYAKFDKAGMKSILAYLKKEGVPVAEVDAPNTQKREAGYPVKTATLSFEDGQTLVLKVKADGGLFQAKLNGKVLAIKKYHAADTFMEEVKQYVKDNAATYAKGKEKAAARAAKEAIRSIKPASSTVTEQTAQVQTAVAELTAANEVITQQIAAIDVASKEGTLADLNTQLKAENSRSEELQAEIDALKGRGFVMEAAKEEPIRVSARTEKDGRVHVLFQFGGRGKGRIVGFYMDKATYRAIPYDVDATPSMYKAKGKIETAPDDFIWESAGEMLCPECGGEVEDGKCEDCGYEADEITEGCKKKGEQ